MYRCLLTGILIVMTGWIRLSSQTLSATEIIRRSEQNVRGVKTAQSEITITLVRPAWTREMGVKTWSKGKDLSMILITAPAKDQGVTFLKRGKEVWNWMPSIERNIKLPPSMMMQSWMGTDFTNDDLVRESSAADDYDHELTGEETAGGLNCYRIVMIPKPDAPVVWGKVIVWIDKKDFIQMRTEMYDEDGILVNIMLSYDIRTLSGKKIATQMELIPQEKKDQKTVMRIRSIVFDAPISDDFFTVQNMKQVR